MRFLMRCVLGVVFTMNSLQAHGEEPTGEPPVNNRFAPELIKKYKLPDVALPKPTPEPKLVKPVKKTWRESAGWQVVDFFKAPKLIELCKAIEAEDLKEIDRLAATGVDVNAKGKGARGDMNPLMWAFANGKLKSFERLLEHGADPNMVFHYELDKNVKAEFPNQLLVVTTSATYLASCTPAPNYFASVFHHGGDPNQVNTSTYMVGASPLLAVIGIPECGGVPRYPGQETRIKRLIELGADFNHESERGYTPARLAAHWGRFDTVLILLNAGANPRVETQNKSRDSKLKLVHRIVLHEKRVATNSTPQQKKEYAEVVKRLEAAGESLDQARDELKRGWYPIPTGGWVLLPASLPPKHEPAAKEKVPLSKPKPAKKGPAQFIVPLTDEEKASATKGGK